MDNHQINNNRRLNTGRWPCSMFIFILGKLVGFVFFCPMQHKFWLNLIFKPIGHLVWNLIRINFDRYRTICIYFGRPNWLHNVNWQFSIKTNDHLFFKNKSTGSHPKTTGSIVLATTMLILSSKWFFQLIITKYGNLNSFRFQWITLIWMCHLCNGPVMDGMLILIIMNCKFICP